MGSHAALIAELVTELEQANEGNRELSDQVLRALGWKLKQLSLSPPGMHGWQAPDGKWPGELPDPTRDLQAAVDLVPEGHPWTLDSIGIVEMGATTGKPVEGIAPTLALALVIAILKAVEAKDG